MALPSSPPITMNELETEFGAPDGTALSEYVRGGAYVPDTPANAGIPDELPISLDDFLDGSGVIPDPDTIIEEAAQPSLVQVDGDLTVDSRSYVLASIANGAKFRFDLTLRCGPGLVDGSQVASDISGYSWKRPRLQFYIGFVTDDPGGGSPDNDTFQGVYFEFLKTDKTSGYVKMRSARGDGSGGIDFGNYMSAPRYFEVNSSQYGTNVIPDEEDYFRIIVTRGEAAQAYRSGGATRYGAIWRVRIVRRRLDDDEVVFDTTWGSFRDLKPVSGGTAIGLFNGGGWLVYGARGTAYGGGGSNDLAVTNEDVATGTTDYTL